MARMEGFEDFGTHTWLNTAHQGALPVCAAQEARTAIEWKTRPYELTQQLFKDVPGKLRAALGRLIAADANDVILANSTSYGLHLIAHAYPWCKGDEVMVADNDFPADILPWLLCERRYGIKVKRIRPSQMVLSSEDLKHAITSRTRLICTTWVNSFSGYAADIQSLGTFCRKEGLLLVVNASQALGARPFKLGDFPVDALTCAGHKWLCGPYGTGFCWIAPALLRKLNPVKAYWLTMRDRSPEQDSVELSTIRTVREFDVFATANFFNFKPWTAAIEYLLRTGVDRVALHDQELVGNFLTNIDKQRYMILSPREPIQSRSTLILISHKDRSNNTKVMARLVEHNIHVALRNGALRISPHLYNSADDINHALSILNAIAF